ncbi:MAG: MATE family efflux transporter [Anaerolineae bacterium]|nr:MATE family efflux transporter [Anaerolineae bacterium]
MAEDASLSAHPFVTAPHRTILALSIPVFFSLVAEPLTGLIDTGYIAQLGIVPLAALGVGTAALSSIFWVFNFLGIGTQTEVAQAVGKHNQPRAVRMTSLALVISMLSGLFLLLLGWPVTPWIAGLLGAAPDTVGGSDLLAQATLYMRIRLCSAPAILLTLVAFGALRGMQDMRTPLWIALLINAINIVVDPLLIYGIGPFSEMGIAGAAWASVVAYWIGAVVALVAIGRKLGFTRQFDPRELTRLFVIGGNLFIRTGLLTLFLLLTTRLATQIGAESGAAHQAIRQVWLFTALGLDALAVTAQSLIGYFEGANWVSQMKRVAALCCGWGVGLGVALSLLMLVATEPISAWLVPDAALPLFGAAWFVAIVVQPVNALAFVTDGVHWGTGDFAFLRNVMIIATGIGAFLLSTIDQANPDALLWVWAVTGIWIAIRAAFGVARVWPGIGRTPFKQPDAVTVA